MFKKKLFNNKMFRQKLVKSLNIVDLSSYGLIRKLRLFKYFNTVLPFISEIINFSLNTIPVSRFVCTKKLKSDFKFYSLMNKKKYYIPILKKKYV